MNKPSWSDAPTWAQWLAQDPNGRWFWYENEPKPSKAFNTWTVPKGRCTYHRDRSIPWNQTLEQRPNEENDL